MNESSSPPLRIGKITIDINSPGTRLVLNKDEQAQTPFELLRDKNLLDAVDGLIDVLDKPEKKIISQRFGLNGGKPKTLEDVGKNLGVTRERIRQLQNIALAKLRCALSKKEDYLAAGQTLAA